MGAMEVTQGEMQYLDFGKKELFERLDKLTEELQSLQRKGVVKLFTKENTANALSELLKQCLDLQFQLIDLPDGDPKGLLEIKCKIVSLENEVARYQGSRSFFESVSVGYTVIVAVMILVLLCDLHTYITDIFGIETPERYITFGFAGAILYFITSIVTGAEQGKEANLPKVLEILFRLILAMVVPIVLVALIFGAGPVGDNASLGPEFLSFACGYSARLVVDIFNKVVDKASKMLDAV